MKKRLLSFVLILCISMSLLSGCAVNVASVGTINGKDVAPGVYHFALTYIVETMVSAKGGVDGYDAFASLDYDGVSATDKAITDTFDLLVELYAAEMILEEEGVTLSEADNKAIESMLSAFSGGQGGTEGLDFMLKSLDMTQEDLREYCRLSYIQYQLNQLLSKRWEAEYADSAEFRAKYESDFMKAKHIFFSTEGATPEESAAILAEAEDVLSQIQNGADFDSFLSQSDDPAALENADGYVFTTGQMEPSFYNATADLALGEVSSVVTTSNGYHIIQKADHMADEQDYLDNLGVLIQLDVGQRVSDLVKEKAQQVEAQINEKEAKNIDINKWCFGG